MGAPGVGRFPSRRSSKKVTGQHPQKFTGEIMKDVSIRYLLYLPEGYGAESRRWPLVLFLHGSGERGRNLNLVKQHGPPKLVEQGRKFDFILVSPQCPEDESWSSPALCALLDDINAHYAVDQSRVYVTGLSMGGQGTWDLALDYPERFAAIAPICGRSNTLRARRLSKVPVRAYHGAIDNVVPVEESVNMVDALKMCGGKPELVIYPGTGHDSWTQSYDNPELYEWMLKHSLKGRR